ncbi:MAG: hypothetical protein HC836_40360 [Richelia sp. RM2_1_2]|nr:hypothetical protein [Richelia sp. SM1_7_0]NJN09236.1 hypothetical protein [Richelia sp. RM1_1_1]NJO27382.1 hypothetical protein [Richelia sp. SL_2_1]NJO64207.1 hypothetical protein [Richelia sp. RM2_1_2]
METITINKSIHQNIDTSSGSNIIRLTPNSTDLNLNPRDRVITRNKYIKNLKAYSNITSIAEANLPDFKFDDSDSEKLNKVLDVEWRSPRKQLDLLIGEFNNWLPVGQISMLNPMGYPYRINNLLDLLTDNLAFELGQLVDIAVKINDVGYGLLEDNDIVTIFGNYVEEITIDDSNLPVTNITEQTILISQTTTILAPSNDIRKFFLMQNISENVIYFSLTPNANIDSIQVMPGGHYQFTTDNVAYFGAITGYSEYNSNVLVIEGS